jgi:monooxygenase
MAHRMLRARNITLSQAFYQLCRRRPHVARSLLRRGLAAIIDDPAVLDEHFTPTYEPWDQRLCVIPDGDLARIVADGRAEVVTDHITRFESGGIRLASGRLLGADLVVLATGLQLLPLGGMQLVVDGEPVDLASRFAYQGLMLTGVPNLALSIGYTNASWTLRSDLVARFVTRLLRHMHRAAIAYAVPRAPAGGATRPLLDLNSGYIRRSEHLFPHQAERNPWRVGQNYLVDTWRMGHADVTKEMTMVPWSTLRRTGSPARSGSPATAGSSGGQAL